MGGEVIILTGPPGAGKTTVSTLVADGASRPTVHVMTDVFFHAIRTGYVLPYLPAAQQQNEIVVDAIVAAVAAYARGDYDVIVDGIVGPWFLPPFQRFARDTGTAVSYVILRPHVDTAISRAQARSGDALTAAEPITDLHRQFAQLHDRESHVIDNTDLDVEQTAAQVRRAVASRRYLLR